MAYLKITTADIQKELDELGDPVTDILERRFRIGYTRSRQSKTSPRLAKALRFNFTNNWKQFE